MNSKRRICRTAIIAWLAAGACGLAQAIPNTIPENPPYNFAIDPLTGSFDNEIQTLYGMPPDPNGADSIYPTTQDAPSPSKIARQLSVKADDIVPFVVPSPINVPIDSGNDGKAASMVYLTKEEILGGKSEPAGSRPSAVAPADEKYSNSDLLRKMADLKAPGGPIFDKSAK